jgi:hypothetical protein
VPDAWRHGPSGPRRAASTIFSWEGRCGRRRLDGQQIRSVTGATPTQYDVGELAKLGRPLTAPGWTTGLRGALDRSLRPQGRLHLGRPGRSRPAERGGPPPQKDMWVGPAASDSGCRWSRSTGRTSSTSDRRPRPRRSRRDEAPGPHGDHTRATSGTGRPQMTTMSFRMSETKSERLSRSARSARQCPAYRPAHHHACDLHKCWDRCHRMGTGRSALEAAADLRRHDSGSGSGPHRDHTSSPGRKPRVRSSCGTWVSEPTPRSRWRNRAT